VKLLLDTHIWLWALQNPSRLSRRVREELRNSSNQLWLSPVSTCEIVLVAQQLPLPHRDPADRFLAATAQLLDLTLVTSDDRLLGLGTIRTMRN
jgi:PIN domain nuclease of toxin-antitoxin system